MSDLHYIGKGIASLGVCAVGAYCMYLTEGQTGIGWVALILILMWG